MRTAILLLLTLTLSSCTNISTTPPDVSLVDIEFGEVAVFETSLLVTTRVTNESSEPLKISGMVHTVSLNGVDLGKARSKQRISLAPLESTRVVSRLEVSHLNLAFNLVDLVNSPKLDYQLDSEFFLAGFGSGTIRTEKSGTLISERPSTRRPSRAQRTYSNPL